ncbi:MAG: Gfo/Idh/MocA family oxidoreductase [Bacteroidales bacterium]|nr:Gfo/Idh/MocA family oxidoreductase [Bacteroidales bacterium]
MAIPYITNNISDIIQDKEVDAVVIASPPQSHHDYFMQFLHAGRHILLEKPSSISLKDLDEMINESGNYPDLVICDCSCRHSRLQPKFRFVKKVIDSGELGDVYYIHHNSVARQSRPGIEYNPDAKWFLNKQIAGAGPLIDWGVYDLSFHLGVLSDVPQFVSSETLFKANKLDRTDPGTSVYDVEEHFAVSMRFNNGLNYYWERAAHANNEAPNETRIYGTHGGLKLQYCTWDSPKVELFGLEKGINGKATKTLHEIDMKDHTDDGYELTVHFLNCIEKKEKPMMPLKLARKHLEIILKI